MTHLHIGVPKTNFVSTLHVFHSFKKDEYPVGHPDIIVNPKEQDIHHYFRMAKVDVLPPYKLYHPILPYRHRGKCTIPCSKSCVQKEMSKKLLDKSHRCSDTSNQRQLRGTCTWCTRELIKAVEVGYCIIKLHEVWHFPPEQRVKGLFADYMNTWLKIKQESAGYPSWPSTPKTKAHYITLYKRKENIDFDPALTVINPGHKATDKLMLNSFWRKFGDNFHKPTSSLQCS